MSEIEHPSHYLHNGVETIDVIRNKLGQVGFLYFCIGNVIKYWERAGFKGDAVTDLEKAKQYLKFMLAEYGKKPTADEVAANSDLTAHDAEAAAKLVKMYKKIENRIEELKNEKSK